MKKLLIILLGLILLGALGYVCIYYFQHNISIQNDIDTRVKKSFDTNGLGHILVNTDGRDITLSGSVASERIKQQSEQFALKILGVRTVNNQITVAANETAADVSIPETDTIKKAAPIAKPVVEPLPTEDTSQSAELTCQQNFNGLLADNKIQFATNSAEIADTSHTLLLDIVSIALQCPNARIEISGHTDSRGSEEYNLNLSQTRASSVMSFLVTNGVKAERLSAVGYGETNPIADNETDVGLARNRRIEFNVEGLEE